MFLMKILGPQGKKGMKINTIKKSAATFLRWLDHLCIQFMQYVESTKRKLKLGS